MPKHQSQYQGKEVDELLKVIQNNKDIINKFSISDKGDLLFDGKSIENTTITDDEITQAISDTLMLLNN